jgi:hypothetical protein
MCARKSKMEDHMTSGKIKLIPVVSAVLLVAVIFQLGRKAMEPPVWTRGDLTRLVEEIQLETHDCLEDNPELFEAIASAEGGLELPPLPGDPDLPGYLKLMSELERSVQRVLGPDVVARLAPTVGVQSALEAVTGSYLAARMNKGTMKLTRQEGAADIYEVEWSTDVISGQSLFLKFNALFGEADQLRSIELVSVTQTGL